VSDKLGLATFEEPRQAFLAASAPAPREYSGATAEAIDLEITAILDAAHRRVSETLTGHRATLEPIFHRRSASIVSIGSRIARYQPRREIVVRTSCWLVQSSSSNCTSTRSGGPFRSFVAWRALAPARPPHRFDSCFVD